MLAQQVASGPSRLPPTPASGPLPALPLQNALGNAALLELLQGRMQAPTTAAPVGGGGEVSAQWAEDIGESDDEVVIGGSVGPDGKSHLHDPSQGGDEVGYGYVGYDDWSAKARAGMIAIDSGAVDMEAMGFDFQAGVWEDDAEHWGMGVVVDGGMAEVGVDVFGDHEGSGGYFRLGGELMSGGAALYYGEDGALCELSGAAMGLFAEAGTGANADSGWDTSFQLNGGLEAGFGSESRFTDEDGDGIEEMNLTVGVGDGFGLGFEVNSEIPAMIAASWGCDLGAFTW